MHQGILKFLYDQSSYTRTAGGVVMILLAFAGIWLPIVLRRNRQRFASLAGSQQWLLAVGLPAAYILLLAGCLEASLRSRMILLRRPFTPTAILYYRPGDSRVKFRGGWRPNVKGAGYNDAELLPDGSEEFSSYLCEIFRRDPLKGPETVEILGRAQPQADGTVDIVIYVDAKEPIRFAVDNLDDVSIMRNGRPLVGSERQLGTFRLTITGRPTPHS